ncbi:hypothetical protein ABPG72_007640 [Tetrahymena utriculariae]
MIQSSQVNQFGYSLTQAGGTGQHGLNQGDDSQSNTNIAGNPLSNSGGGTTNNLVNSYRAPNLSHNVSSLEQYTYNTSILGQNQNSNNIRRNYKNVPQANKMSGDAVQDDQNAIRNNINSQRVAFQADSHLNPYPSTKITQGSYVTQNPPGAQQQVFLQNDGGAELNQQGLKTSLSNIPGSQREILQTNSSLNLSNEIENNIKQKICSYSFIPNSDKQEKVLHIKGGIMVDEKVILAENSEDYLVHQNFSQYIDCQLIYKLQMNCGEGNQPIEIVEIPIKKKEGDTQFSDFVTQFKNGNASSYEIAHHLEQYQYFVNSQMLQNSSSQHQQNLLNNSNKAQNIDCSHLQSQSFANQQLNSSSQVKQEYAGNLKINSGLILQQKQHSQNYSPFQVQSGAQIVGQGLGQKVNNSFSNPATSELYQQKLSQSKEENNSLNPIGKKNNQNQLQQQFQNQTKIELGTELNRSNSGGNKSKQIQQQQQQQQQQQSDGVLNQEQTDNNNSDQNLEKIQRESINNILLRHKSDYFSYVVVFKSQSEGLDSQHQNQHTAGQLGNQQYKEDKMVIGHSTKFLNLLSQDDDLLLASKMIREKKLCIFLTKLNKENYIEYLKQRISSELQTSNGVSQQFPFTCISSLDHVFKPTLSYVNVKNLTKPNTQTDEKSQNLENHLNSSTSSSTVQQQLQQQQQQQQLQLQQQQNLNKGQHREQPINSSKCPFSNSFENKLEVKTYKQMDVITLDNLLFKVDIEVIEEQTMYFKIVIFKYIITDLHIQELEHNRGASINKQTTSLNQSGGGTPFQRRPNKRPSLKQQQTFSDVTKFSRDKSVSMGDDKQRSQAQLNNSSSSLKNIPLAASSTQDIFNPKNMQYETNSEKFIIKFYPQQSQNLSKSITENLQASNKASSESSSRNKSSKINFSKEQTTFNNQAQLAKQQEQQQQQQQPNQSEGLMDEEYLEMQFKYYNPTYDNNNNQAENFGEQQSNMQFAGQNSISEFQQHNQQGQNAFGKEQSVVQDFQPNSVKIQTKQNQDQQPTQFQILAPQINQQNQAQQQQIQSQIFKIEIPKQNQSSETLIQNDKKAENESNIFKLVRPNPANSSQPQIPQEEQIQNQKGKKKPQPRSSKKKQDEGAEEQQNAPAAKTKRIKKDTSSIEENKKDSVEIQNVEKKQPKRSKKQKESDKQDKQESEGGKVDELEQNKKQNDIVSLKNIPISQEQLTQQNSHQFDSSKVVRNISQANIQAYQAPQQQQPQQQLQLKQAVQHPYNQQAQIQQQPQYNINQQNLQMAQQQNIQQQKQPFSNQVNQQQNPMYQQYQHQNLQQQNPNNLQVYYNQNSQQIPQQQMQQGQYININGKLYQQGYLKSPRLNYSPQLTNSPYQQSQKLPNYSPSPNLIAQNTSQSAPNLPPLDLNQTNPMYQQYKQLQNFQNQQNQQKQQNPFQIPQAKSQPVLGSTVTPHIQSQEVIQAPIPALNEQQKQESAKIQAESQSQMQEEQQQDSKQKKGKKKEVKQKKQPANKSPSKNIQEEELNDKHQEDEQKKQQAPSKQKRISKKIKNETQQPITNQNEEKPQKKQYQRKPKASKQKSEEEEVKEQNNSLIASQNQNQQDSNLQINQDENNLNQQKLKQVDQPLPHKVQNTSDVPNHPIQPDLSYQQQQQQIYYQQSQYYPYQHAHDNYYDQEYYNTHNYQYSQYQNPEISHHNTQQHQHQQQGSTSNQQYYMNNDYFNLQNYNYYYQQNEHQPHINSQHSQKEINNASNQSNQVEQSQNEGKNTKKPKSTQPKQKADSSKGTTKNGNSQKNEQK